jgi:hypothetical protein
MGHRLAYLPAVALHGMVAICWSIPLVTQPQGSMAGEIGKIEIADPTRPSDGTIHPAALAAQIHGPLPVNAAEAAYQGALDRARPHVLGPATPRGPALSAMVDPPLREGLGLRYFGFTPSGASGAKGPNRYWLGVNRVAALFDEGLQQIIRRPLTSLGGLHPSVVTQNPQLIWDPRTRRFYYAMSASEGANENRVAFGFSKGPNPNNLSSAWCHYTYNYASRFLDHLSLGDNRDFIIFTGNAFQPSFVGSDINAVSKPPAGTTCPNSASFKTGFSWNLRDSGNVLVQSPVAANQIDDRATGYVAARHGDLISGPSNKLWFYNVTRDPGTGNPLFSSARQLTLPNTYALPPVAEQPTKPGQPFTRLRTLDARLTNATMAHKLKYEDDIFYTQHTVRHPTENRSIVRWYEIDPVLNPPVIRRTGTIGEEASHAGRFFFNAAIAPDRQVDGATKRFGNNFVIVYNFSSATINPSIGAASSVNGGPLTFRTVQNGVAPYTDLSCPNNGDVCNWLGASAAPDPRPDPSRPRTSHGLVWSTMQYSSDPTPDPDRTDWGTRIFAQQP